ncbi:hypothetical protein V2G26_014779 [Clonostachys chloroleuca]
MVFYILTFHRLQLREDPRPKPGNGAPVGANDQAEPPAPNPTAVPHIWRYKDIRPSLGQTGKLVTEDQAERRVLMLINPARDAPYTTDTLYAGLQLVMPNEVARAHRHTAFAMRFIIEGQARRRDPQPPKDGSGPMIWLDGLDLPNFRHFPVHFVEHFQEKRYPAEDVDTSNSPIVFPWAKMKARLDDGKDWATKDYPKADRRPVSRVLGGSAERVAAGCSSPGIRETASSVYHIVSGKGHSTVGDETIQWEAGDTFCLYRFHDKRMLTALGFYRVEGVDVETLVSD